MSLRDRIKMRRYNRHFNQDLYNKLNLMMSDVNQMLLDQTDDMMSKNSDILMDAPEISLPQILKVNSFEVNPPEPDFNNDRWNKRAASWLGNGYTMKDVYNFQLEINRNNPGASLDEDGKLGWRTMEWWNKMHPSKLQSSNNLVRNPLQILPTLSPQPIQPQTPVKKKPRLEPKLSNNYGNYDIDSYGTGSIWEGPLERKIEKNFLNYYISNGYSSKLGPIRTDLLYKSPEYIKYKNYILSHFTPNKQLFWTVYNRK